MNTAPKWLLPVSIVALLWNIMGTMNFLYHVTLSPEALAELDEMTQQIVNEQPLWSWIGFGVATISGLLGCVGLIMKKKWAYGLFLLSILGVMVNSYYSYVQSDAMDGFGGSQYVMPIIVTSIAIFLIIISKKGIREEWLT